MANRTWIGGAAATAEVWATTIASSTAAQTFQIILTDESGGSVTLSYTAGGAETPSTIATALAAVVTASQDPRAKAVSASVNTATITLTANSAGVPFYPATGGTGSFSGTGIITKNIGPNDWNTQANWAENTVPVGGDNVTLTGSNPILYGLQTALAIGAFNGAPGSAVRCGSAGLWLTFTSCTSFYWAGTGLSFVDIGTSNINPRIVNTAGATAPAGGLNLKGTNIAAISLEGGSLDIGVPIGTTSTAATIQVSGNGRVRCGPSLTLTTYQQDAGTGELGCACTTATCEGGTLTTVGTGAITTLNANGGTVTSNSTGTVTTANINNSATLDMTQSQTPRTITNVVPSRGAKFLYDPAVVTVANKIAPLTTQGPLTVTVQ